MISTRTMTNIAVMSLIAMSITGCSWTTPATPASDLTGSTQTGDMISTGMDGSDGSLTSEDEEALKILNQILQEVEAISGDINTGEISAADISEAFPSAGDKTNK